MKNRFFSLLILILTCFFQVNIFADGDLFANVRLIMAVDAQNLKEVQKAITDGAEVNCEVDGISPFHLAVTLANKEMVELLVKLGANIYKKIEFNNQQINPIELAQFYVEACSSVLKGVESFKVSKDYLPKKIDFIEYACQECLIRLRKYKSVLNVLEFYDNLLQDDSTKINLDVSY